MKAAVKMIKLNLDDLGVAAAIVGGTFLLLEAVIAAIMLVQRERAETSIAMGWVLLPVMAGFACLFFNSMQVTIGFDLLLRYGVTRRSSILAVAAHMLTMTCFSFVLAFALGELDRLIAHFWMRTMHLSMVELADGHIPLYVFLLIPLGLTVLGLGSGALLQRFGIRGFWVLWGAWMVLMIGQSAIPWEGIFETVSASPVLSVLACCGVGLVILVLSVWSLMRSTVKN